MEADCDQTTCNFSVTVQHEDSGWDHYADHWRVLDANGAELGRRVLLHPHVNEQPFTRRLNDVVIGSDINRVVIESHDSVHGYGGATLEVGLQR